MTTDAPQISEREREILRLVAKGATNQQIAQELHISINTVKVHLRNIFGKIGATSRTEATVFAIRQGLVAVSGSALDQAEAISAPPEETLLQAPRQVIEPVVDVLETPMPELVAPDEAAIPKQVLPVEPEETVLASTPAAVEHLPTASTARRFPVWLVGAAVVALVLAAIGGYTLRSQNAPPPAPTQGAATSQVAPRWKPHAALPEPRADFALTSYDGFLYAISGRRSGTLDGGTLRYSISEDRWQTLKPKPTPVLNARAVAIGGRIYVPGGEDASGVPLTTGEVYDIRTDTWSRLPDLPAPRSRYALASIEGTLYLFGGWDGTSYRNEVFALNPDNQTWKAVAPMPTARRGASAAVLNDAIYVVGGENQSGPLRTNERFQPFVSNNGTWKSVEPLPAPVAAPVAIGLYTTLSVVNPSLGSIQFYTPTNESWTTKSFTDVPFSSTATGAGTSIFLFGPVDTAGKIAPLNEFQGVYQTYLPGTLSN